MLLTNANALQDSILDYNNYGAHTELWHARQRHLAELQGNQSLSHKQRRIGNPCMALSIGNSGKVPSGYSGVLT